jgi:hypothetical protein
MRNFIAVVLVTVAALVAGPVVAADLPQYSPVANPPVSNGMSGSFYLRASVGVNSLFAHNIDYTCGCGGTEFDIANAGYGYSFGSGFGYETGTGLRVDATLDYLSNDHMTTGGLSNIDLSLRSTILLANAYYDFGFGGMGSGAGGFGAYVGAGVGGAQNQVADNASSPASPGTSYTAVGAVMAGVTYDMGNMVADLGYRGIYMPTISNNSLTDPYYFNGAFISEVRGTLRYRFN